MNKPGAILFDVDGTLAETERDGHRVALNQAFREFGLDWHWSVELYGELLAISGSKERMLHYLTQQQPALLDRPDLDTWLTSIKARKTELYNHLIAKRPLALRPGVSRLIHSARQNGITLAIATTTTPENVDTLLRHSLAADAPDWFDCIAAGDIVADKKPAADIYELALQQLALPASACIAIEDSANGLQSALAAGITTLVTVADYTRDHDFSGAALVVDSLGEPDRPFQVLAGDPGTAGHVDIALLQRLLDRPSQASAG